MLELLLLVQMLRNTSMMRMTPTNTIPFSANIAGVNQSLVYSANAELYTLYMRGISEIPPWVVYVGEAMVIASSYFYVDMAFKIIEEIRHPSSECSTEQHKNA